MTNFNQILFAEQDRADKAEARVRELKAENKQLRDGLVGPAVIDAALFEASNRWVTRIRELEDVINAKHDLFERMQHNYEKEVAKNIRLEARLERLRLALEPFAHDDLSALRGGNLEGDASIVFQRNEAILRIGDFRKVCAVLAEKKDQ